jgi:hypothetical protein
MAHTHSPRIVTILRPTGLRKNALRALRLVDSPGYRRLKNCLRFGLSAAAAVLLVAVVPFSSVYADDDPFPTTVCEDRVVGSLVPGYPNSGDCTKPFFIAQGGDVVDGGDFSDPNTGGRCYQTDFISTGSWDNENVNNNGYFGAGTQDNDITPDTQQQFASGLNSAVPDTSTQYIFPGTMKPYTEAFANTDQNSNLIDTWVGVDEPYIHTVNDLDSFGGDFTDTPCMPDYYDQANVGTVTAITGNSIDLGLVPANSTVTYTYTDTDIHNGDINNDMPLTITDSAPITAKSITIKIAGDAYIDSNIEFGDTSLAALPQLNIIAADYNSITHNSGDSTNKDVNSDGNILVNNLVTAIHGHFVAEGSTLANLADQPSTDYISGIFGTCATDSAGVVSQSTNYDICDHQLIIYGSVEANLPMLERTYGDVLNMQPGTTNQANAAEVFQYSPETWVPSVDCTTSIAGCIGSSFESETSLPPVL